MKKATLITLFTVLFAGSNLNAFSLSPSKQVVAITAGLAASYGLLYYNKYKDYCKAVREAEHYVQSSQDLDALDCIGENHALQRWGMDQWPTAEALRDNEQDVIQALAQQINSLNLCQCYGLFTYKKLIKALDREQKKIEHLRQRLESFYYVNPQPQGEGWLQSVKSVLVKLVRRDLPVQYQTKAARLSGELYQLELRLQAIKDISQQEEARIQPQGQSFLPIIESNAPHIRKCHSPYCCNK